MRYIETLRDGDRITGIYLCKYKQAALTKNGKSYENVILQDKTGTIDSKVWEPNSPGIGDFEAMDYVEIAGDVVSYQGALQLSIKRSRKAMDGSYDPKDYVPVSEKDIEEMYRELLGFISGLKDPYLKRLAASFFVEDQEFTGRFKFHSAAKNVHHGFVGGLLEHTLSVVKLCDYYCKAYPVLNKDLLITAAIFHDIGKLDELAAFPANDYTDDGQLLGHIVMGCEAVGARIRMISGFPPKLASELKHCILAHHGELEFGSPKKPALVEAVALNFADNTDAKLQTMTEAFKAAGNNDDWLGYNRLFESNIRKTSK
ncbi:3'-5' exoribonuclease YhaM family protein [Diplocloster agilis]|uniref:3'-5' exoribonuclease YhaM family protein n=1 Tax=Diplocloster agilis TaxID=2850323 RepID=UPI000820B60B|nr:HD domain-containing protein [Suonthocola fibrivorans]MCU6732129.1 HD domain-containing protein [Suonthocola fibrivorans]SCI34472.1 3'-5' exoribonuclease yhaM [uncultured Clostridium sp.]